MLELWHANRILPVSRRRPVIAEILERHEIPATVDQVLEHTRSHRAPQPAPTARQVDEGYEEFFSWVTRKPRRLEVLCFIAQAKIASPAQIAEAFITEGSPEVRIRIARRLLREAAYRDGLYRVFFDNWAPSRREVSEVYSLGRTGAELLSSLTGTAWDWTAEPAQVSPYRQVHDTGVGDYAISMRKSCGELELRGLRLRAQLNWENFWATELGVKITVPEHLDELLRQQKSAIKQVVPDGFMSVGVELLDGSAKGVAPSFALPFVLERDRSRRDPGQICEQVVLNMLASQSGAWRERFPELKEVKDLRPPLVFVIESRVFGDVRKGGDSTRRLMNLKAAVEKALAERVLTGSSKQSMAELFKGGPACLLARDPDIREHGLQAPVVPLFSKVEQVSDGPTLLEALIAGSRPVVSSGAVKADAILTLDPQGARWDWSPRKGRTSDGEAHVEPLGGREQRRIGEDPAQRKAAEAALRKRRAEREAYEARFRAAQENAEVDRG